ncbi:hypothetical protein FJZ28_05280 [Candidatus Peregrinibacteria bacterium]|nr:hypothetical protein [Candidatus Peregrinibacteria bacterium]
MVNTLPVTPTVAPATQEIIGGTSASLNALRASTGVPVLTNAMQSAISIGVNSIPILGGMALVAGGIMTLFGKPPNWVQNLTGQKNAIT